jgi:hypothetical protein
MEAIPVLGRPAFYKDNSHKLYALTVMHAVKKSIE